MNIKDAVIKIFEQVKIEDEYQNPHFLSAILVALEDVYGYENESFEKFTRDMWSR